MKFLLWIIFKNINYLYDGLYGLKCIEGCFIYKRILYIFFKLKYKCFNKMCGLFICRYFDYDIEFYCFWFNEIVLNKFSVNVDKEDM